MRRELLLGIFFVSAGAIASASELRQLCRAGGYNTAVQNNFLAGLAAHILTERGSLGSSECSPFWRQGFEFGERFHRTGKIQGKADEDISKDIGDFGRRVNAAVGKLAGY